MAVSEQFRRNRCWGDAGSPSRSIRPVPAAGKSVAGCTVVRMGSGPRFCPPSRMAYSPTVPGGSGGRRAAVQENRYAIAMRSDKIGPPVGVDIDGDHDPIGEFWGRSEREGIRADEHRQYR